MKKLCLALIVSFAIQNCMAIDYDVILTTERHQIQCVIIAQNDSIVVYRLANSSNGELKTLAKEDIAKIYPRTEDPRQQPIVDTENVHANSSTSINNTNKETSDRQSDTIELVGGESIFVNVVEVGSNEIKYRKVSNPEGPIYVKKVSEVRAITYKNGESDYFTTNSTPAQQSEHQAVTNVSSSATPQPEYRPVEKARPEDREWPGGGRHTDKDGNTRTDFPGGHKTVHADGSETISVPFVTINKKGGGKGVDMPSSDDVYGFQIISFYGAPEDDVILINKSSKTDCFKVAVCSVENNQYFWKIVLTTQELQPYDSNIPKKQNQLYSAKSKEELNELLTNKDRYIYSIAVKSRYNYEYSFRTRIDGDDLVIEVLDLDSSDSDW